MSTSSVAERNEISESENRLAYLLRVKNSWPIWKQNVVAYAVTNDLDQEEEYEAHDLSQRH